VQQDDVAIGDRLWKQGWRQGAMFVDPHLSFGFNARNGDEVFAPQARKVKPKEQMVVISQDCDILAADEPFVEALICRQDKASFCAKVERNSARFFVVDPPNCWLAVAYHRVQIAKSDLLALTPKPWPADTKRLERFVRWLARRYDRPAIPDQLVKAFQVPLAQALEVLDSASPTAGLAISRATTEWRVTLPSTEQPPFHVQLLLLLSVHTLSAEEANAIALAEERIRATIDPDVVRLHPIVRMVTEEELSLKEYRATCLLFLEPLTYRGEEVVGAPPLDRA